MLTHLKLSPEINIGKRESKLEMQSMIQSLAEKLELVHRELSCSPQYKHLIGF